MLLNRQLFSVDPTTFTIPNDGVTKVLNPQTPEQWEVLRYELSHFVSENLARRYLTLEAIRRLTLDDLVEAVPQKRDPSKFTYRAVVPGIGKKIVHKFLPGLAAKSDLIDALIAHVTVLDHVPEVKPTGDDAPLAGLSFVFTGALEQMTRKEAQQKVKSLGGDAPSSVSARLTYLVVGGDPGANKSSKHKKAEAYMAKGAETKIVTEAEFVAIHAGGDDRAPTG